MSKPRVVWAGVKLFYDCGCVLYSREAGYYYFDDYCSGICGKPAAAKCDVPSEPLAQVEEAWSGKESK